MTKIRVEVCIISARGLRRSSSLLRPQWFAVGWIDANNKYCTKVDTSGGSNPTWKTKFFIDLDDVSSNMQGKSLTVEVYRRDPIFLREKLQGAASIALNEFLAKFTKDNEATTLGVEEIGSFQLRKRKSGKPQGFVDISVRIFEERAGNESYWNSDQNNDIQLAIEDGPVLTYRNRPQLTGDDQFGGYTQNNRPQLTGNGQFGGHSQSTRPQLTGNGQVGGYTRNSQPRLTDNDQYGGYNQISQPRLTDNDNDQFGGYTQISRPQLTGNNQFGGHTQISHPYSQPRPHPSIYQNPAAPGTMYHRPPTPPPPPPPSNAGFLPTLFPAGRQPPDSYINLPASRPPQQRNGAALGMGLGAGALAAGAVIFGDDFMSGSNFTTGFEGGSLSVSTDPPF